MASPEGSPELNKAAKVEAVVALIDARSQKAERASLTTFARGYFERVDPEDIAARQVEDLYGALLSHWQFARKRESGSAKVRVFNPGAGEHGWASRHTVVEVLNDDMPFLVDSASMEINRQALTLHLIVHPIFAVERDKNGVLQTVDLRQNKPDWPRESFMHIEVDRLADPAARAELSAGIERVLGDVRASVTDWKAMVAQLRSVIEEIDRQPPPLAHEEVAENRAFLQWLTEDHLLLLGYRRHDLATVDGEDALRLVPGSGLGILRESESETALSGSFAVLPPQARAVAHAISPMMFVTKANSRSTVHRPGYIDYIGVKRYSDGAVIGEHRFVGLFTSTAYSARVAEVPLIRGKVEAVARRSGLAPGSHLGKAMTHVLETYPRDELFQITVDELHEIAIGIVQLGERQRFRLFIRRDPFERFVSCLIFVPRENYTTELRRRFQKILIEAFDGSTADFDVLLTDAVLARIHITVRTTPGKLREVDLRAIEAQLAGAARRWEDDLRQALNDEEGEGRAAPLYKRFGSAFPTAYEEAVSPRQAVADIRRLDILATEPTGGLALNLYRPLEGPQGRLGFKLYRSGAPIALSDSLPMLERMGVRVLSERGYQITADDGAPLWVHDFSLQLSGTDDIDAEAIAPLFEESFARVFKGGVENDDFNRLVLRAGLSADEIVVLRAYAKVMRQTGFALSQAFIETTLSTHPRIARMLVGLFKLRFDPAQGDKGAAASQVNAIEQALDKVSNLSEDKVLRQYLALIVATLRTNYWRTGVGTSGAAGPRRAFLSLKFNSAQIPGLPEPRPLFEIFVYSTRFEGVHLRGGKVARGGLRWSDRPEDFRTEVLGLVKAQMVKNTVIVPVGSKGGFVLKKAPPMADREAYLKEGVDCYRDYLRGLLDLTDNRVGDAIVPPPHVVRHDADDPYLVVAADKGTATFSDYANAVSAEYGFWLGDAFASGGSAGYDHKEMGITARGAWESVKRHFREIGINMQTTEFTCVGIGDMSGDVFGNGMLLSRHIRLLAAFDHRHVFIDPAPDVATSFAERARLFALPRSSWADYNQMLISAGGGIWARSEKSIPISPQTQAALGIAVSKLTPSELISAILKAPVDLLYNGGIGTYVKSATQSHADVGDRANDTVRVNGAELRCKVVCEGGNLGFTQLGRIEAALNGVKLYTDAIDNSAGVDTSDHEVNIKILLSLPIADGELTEKQRNAQLVSMTDDVAALVLRDNYFQGQSLSVSGRMGTLLLDHQQRFIRFLEKRGLLNRAIEFLPSDDEIEERRAKDIPLTGPERAVLLAYSKMWLFDELLASDLPEDPWVGTALARYFPSALKQKFAPYIERHPLKREIVATHVLNSMVNRVGATFVHRRMETAGATPAQVVRAYLLTREAFGLVPVWQAIEALDNVVPDELQSQMVIDLGRRTVRATNWFLRSRRLVEPMAATIERFAQAAAALLQFIAASPASTPWRAAIAQHQQALVAKGVPPPLALAVAASDTSFATLDITEVSDSSKQPLTVVANTYFSIGEVLGLARLRTQVSALSSEGYWQSMAKSALADDLAALQRELTADALQAGGQTAWELAQRPAVERAQRMLAELADTKSADLAMLSVALRELRHLA
ncbi:MAG TPA: NAD-glutamate dehydrogenase [Burkholderiaceae bacterium]|nr:NAD-glutamate dehydrogenase [Burkholderiaceae bacterium]